MPGLRWSLPWPRRARKEEPSPGTPPPPPPAPAAPLRRTVAAASQRRHEWLDVSVARLTPLGPVPLAQARVVVRPWPAGEAKPGEPVARGLTDAQGATAFHLPVGRYALAATHGGEAKAVAVTLDHAGRAHVLLDRPARLATLSVQLAGAPRAGIAVEAFGREGEVVARALADERGHALLALLPGPYEVRAAGVSRSVHVESDARLALPLGEAPGDDPRPALAEAAARPAPFEPSLDGPWN